MRHGDILSYFLPDGHKKSGIFSIVQKTDQKYFLWGALVLSRAKKKQLFLHSKLVKLLVLK